MLWIIIALIFIVGGIITLIGEKVNIEEILSVSLIFSFGAFVLIAFSTFVELGVTGSSVIETFTIEDVVEIKESSKRKTIKLENENIYNLDGSIEIKEGVTYTIKEKDHPLWVSIVFTCFFDEAFTEYGRTITATYNPNEL